MLFYVNTRIYSIILLENQVFTPDLLVGKLSNLLDSALETPFQSFGGDELYPTIQAKAARLGYGLIKNHCMIDGNKRIGTHAMLVFLALNGIELKYTQKELYETILNVASGSVDYNGLLQWVLNHQN